MRPSALWIVTATALALFGLWLQFPRIHHGKMRSTSLQQQFGYPPDAWWEPIVWPLAFFAAIMVLVLARAIWLSRKASMKEPPKRWRPPMEGE